MDSSSWEPAKRRYSRDAVEPENEKEARQKRYLLGMGEAFSRDQEPLLAREIDPKHEPRFYDQKVGEADEEGGGGDGAGEDGRGVEAGKAAASLEEDLLADEYLQQHWAENAIPRHVMAKMQFDAEQEADYDKYRNDPTIKVPLDPMTWKKRHVRAWFKIHLCLGQYVGKFPEDWQPEIVMDESTVGF